MNLGVGFDYGMGNSYAPNKIVKMKKGVEWDGDSWLGEQNY